MNAFTYTLPRAPAEMPISKIDSCKWIAGSQGRVILHVVSYCYPRKVAIFSLEGVDNV
jgi:hypothetical protein